MTDSEEEELSDSEQDDQDQPEDELYILIQRVDRLHHGTDSDKRESLHILLEHREQVRNTLKLVLLWYCIVFLCFHFSLGRSQHFFGG